MEKGKKPYLKLASSLVVVGAGMFMLERYGLTELTRSGRVHIDPNLMSVLVIVPILLVLAGAIVFMVGKMRRL